MDPTAAHPSPLRGLWLEELPVGFRLRHAMTRTVTEADNVLFTTMTMNPQPLHLDAEYAAGTEFGQRVVNSMLTLALVVGLTVADLTLGTLVAQLGIERVSFPHPVFHGDTLHVETEVVAARPSSSRPGQGIVTFRHHGANQRDEEVVTLERVVLVRAAPPE
jgi:acyl dehydratase